MTARPFMPDEVAAPVQFVIGIRLRGVSANSVEVDGDGWIDGGGMQSVGRGRDEHVLLRDLALSAGDPLPHLLGAQTDRDVIVVQPDELHSFGSKLGEL